ncbi:type III-B CRISPR module RAMP protein Cmr6, partial [Thermogutta sp.]|uniref:type III-B CRISPR module RAMP protein Cmr6 n=1 Tax=Thermogutta sp. TaxID=1962930 RepID=UPI00321FF285
MAMIVPLPKPVRDLLSENTHLGLQLDKYVQSWSEELFSKSGDNSGKLSERVQKPTVDKIADKSKNEPPGLNYDALFDRWQTVVAARGAMTFKAKTVGPLTLHLARASALENAGICLHPIYGFVYLPGTGLKGMARAFAETVWLPTQTDQKKAWQQIEDVFGWAPNPDRQKQIKANEHPAEKRYDPENPKAEITASVGQIIFLDAWPEKWTPLVADILNNHHASYYQDQEPPGDWDSPIPVYFLAVSAGHTFFFALAKRRADVPNELLQLATEWLIGALEYEGAGAKTASGYGSFKVTEPPKPFSQKNVERTWKEAKQKRAEFTCTLELVTPAFLAGPWQKEEDCELRPATLRGMLRWWWRTMHAAHVDAVTLYRMESAIWGDTNSCGAVRVTVEPLESMQPVLFDKKEVRNENKLPPPPNKKTTPGLDYFTFGMDDMRKENGQRKRYKRYYLTPNAKWRVTMRVRPKIYEIKNDKGIVIDKWTLAVSDLLPQAQAALWLLCYYGGVGSKSRKGFGCFDVPAELSRSNWKLEKCKEVAAEFRKACRLSRQEGCHAPTLETMIAGKELRVPWKNVWWVLDAIGAAAQAFAQQYARNPQKLALGLPRNVRAANVPGQFKPGEHVAETGRHASPLIFHVGRQNGHYVVRCVGFPSPELPDDPTRKKSQDFLNQAIDTITKKLT